MNFISASAMRFRFHLLFFVGLFLMHIYFAGASSGKILDMVVASVDDMVITKSELDERCEAISKINKDITRMEVLQGMINRELLLKEARKYRMEGIEDEIITQYIDLKIRALIRIQDIEIKKYYEEHKEEFRAKIYEDAYNDIVKYLTELSVNESLKKHIDTLRNRANISIKLKHIE